MRFTDLLNLALSGLWQQKLRTTLTMLGVVFGSFVLLASLSVRTGVKQRIVEEYARFRELREITVHPRFDFGAHEPPKEKLNIRGDMSGEKRKRLRAAITRDWQWNNPRQVEVRITSKRIAEIKKIPHVSYVDPHLLFHAHIALGGEADYAMTHSATANDQRLPKRIIAGKYFTSDNDRKVVVDEYLLYRLGVVSDDDVAKTIGKKLRIEYRHGGPRPETLVSFVAGSNADGAAKHAKLLAKFAKQLPDAIDHLNLTVDEKSSMRLLLQPKKKLKEDGAITVFAEYPICGVLRSLSIAEMRDHGRRPNARAELIVPVDTLADLVFRIPKRAGRGFESVVVEVDDVKNVKAVSKQIEASGLGVQNLVTRIEHEQALYTMIFSAMTIVAVIALLVAALGITNTMFMSVLERVREIGIMKAIGAHHRHVQIIFLIEGALIGIVGGMMGMFMAWLASNPGDAWVRSMVQEEMSIQLHGSIFAFPLWLMIGVPVFATVVTTLAAFFPARRAARVNPVTALRHD